MAAVTTVTNMPLVTDEFTNAPAYIKYAPRSAIALLSSLFALSFFFFCFSELFQSTSVIVFFFHHTKFISGTVLKYPQIAQICLRPVNQRYQKLTPRRCYGNAAALWPTGYRRVRDGFACVSLGSHRDSRSARTAYTAKAQITFLCQVVCLAIPSAHFARMMAMIGHSGTLC